MRACTQNERAERHGKRLASNAMIVVITIHPEPGADSSVPKPFVDTGKGIRPSYRKAASRHRDPAAP